MKSNRRDRDDDENTSFEVAEGILEDLKPGFSSGEKKAARATGKATEGGGGGSEVHDRFPQSERKDVPRGTLAEQIRNARKGAR